MQQADELQTVARLRDAHARILEQIRRVIVGQDQVIDEMLIAVFSRGHCLLVGVPGLAKTLLVSTLARTLSLTFKRIQFTPDLMPSDITGTEILAADPATGQRQFKFLKGPVFAHLILADEINRTPPKTQAALLEAMQEKKVSAGGEDFPLEEPFFVLATQNPIEQEGTYPLPEAQLDRFMLELRVGYPSKEEEESVVERTTGSRAAVIRPVLDAVALRGMQQLVRRIPGSKGVVRAAVSLARMTRPQDVEAPGFIREYVEWGAGPRASQYLVLGAKARAAMDGRPMADLDDVKSVAAAVLRHRVVTNFSAEAADRKSEDIVAELLRGREWGG